MRWRKFSEEVPNRGREIVYRYEDGSGYSGSYLSDRVISDYDSFVSQYPSRELYWVYLDDVVSFLDVLSIKDSTDVVYKVTVHVEKMDSDGVTIRSGIEYSRYFDSPELCEEYGDSQVSEFTNGDTVVSYRIFGCSIFREREMGMRTRAVEVVVREENYWTYKGR